MPKVQAKSHKKYGPKMDRPRIRASKEHRHRGSLGYYVRACDRGLGRTYTTRAEWIERGQR